jgi:hypothetical protein
LALADLSFNWHFGGVFGWTTEPIAKAMEKER